MKEFIIANYDGRTLTTYKGDWKRRFEQTLKLLNRKYERCIEEAWPKIIDTVLRANKSSNLTTTSNRQISEEEKRVVIEIFDNIKGSDKWVLSVNLKKHQQLILGHWMKFLPSFNNTLIQIQYARQLWIFENISSVIILTQLKDLTEKWVQKNSPFGNLYNKYFILSSRFLFIWCNNWNCFSIPSSSSG